MKIINNTNAYVQKKDLDYLINRNLSLPESIILKIHNEITINENNKYEFVEFKNIKEIKYFKSLDWIVDYKQVNKLTENEITDLCKKIADEINEISDKYKSLSNLEKLENYDMIKRCELLEYKMHSLRDALWFKQWQLNIEIPETKYKQFIKIFNKKKTPK